MPWPAYLVLFILLLSGLYAWNRHRYQFDDAYISYRYARNLASGNGPVFNVGDRIEGYSNFLWVLMLALGAWMKIPPPALAPVLGVLSYLVILGVCWCVIWIAIRDWGIGRRAIASVLLFSLVLSHGLAVTAGSGLETHFYAALVLLSLTTSLLIERRPRLLVPAVALLLSLLVLTRPDGFVPAGVILLLGFLHLLGRNRSVAAASRAILPVAWAPAMTLAVHWTWRVMYYGSFLPNPYFAKGANTPQYRAGIEYVWAFLASYPAVVFLLACMAVFLLRVEERDLKSRYVVSALVVSLFYALLLVQIGGDFMDFRLCFHFLPVLMLAGIIAVVSIIPPRFASGCVMGAIVLGLCLAPARLEMDYYMQSLEEMDRYVKDGAMVGKALKDLPPDTTIATTLVGTMGYYSGLPIVDQWGLVDGNVRRRKPREAFVRGHVRFTPASEALEAGADLYFEHPHFCDCTKECLKSEHEVAVQLAGAGCVRALVISKKDEFRNLICAQPGTFPIIGKEVCDR